MDFATNLPGAVVVEPSSTPHCSSWSGPLRAGLPVTARDTAAERPGVTYAEPNAGLVSGDTLVRGRQPRGWATSPAGEPYVEHTLDGPLVEYL
jgi:hypothetical protein